MTNQIQRLNSGCAARLEEGAIKTVGHSTAGSDGLLEFELLSNLSDD